MRDADMFAATVARLTRERDEARESLAWWTEPQSCDLRHTPPFDFGQCEAHDRTFPLGGTCDHAGLSEIEWMEQREKEQRARAIRAEGERDEARADYDEAHAILERLSNLLTRTINALRGDPPPLTSWSFHDIPDLAAAVIAERDEARANPRDEYRPERVVKAEALPLETLDAIVEHLMADGSRAGLIHANTLNQAFGRSARRLAAKGIERGES